MSWRDIDALLGGAGKQRWTGKHRGTSVFTMCVHLEAWFCYHPREKGSHGLFHL